MRIAQTLAVFFIFFPPPFILRHCVAPRQRFANWDKVCSVTYTLAAISKVDFQSRFRSATSNALLLQRLKNKAVQMWRQIGKTLMYWNCKSGTFEQICTQPPIELPVISSVALKVFNQLLIFIQAVSVI